MNILFVSAEAVPLAKVGGMADVIGSLPPALRRLGVDARIIIPGYGFINHQKHDINHLFSFHFSDHNGPAHIHVYMTRKYYDVPIYLVQVWPYFGNEESVYTDWGWDSPRFIYFNKIMMGVVWELGKREGWFPDLLHVNDWHTGLLPFLLHENRHNPAWNKIATVLSIHNLIYQGDYTGGWMWNAGIPARTHPHLIYQNLTDNIMAAAIAYSDVVTTVSPRYAIEIQYPYMGYGLDGLIHTRKNDLYGILNGIDEEFWDPKTDTKLTTNFDVNSVEEKRHFNKRKLQADMGLEVRDDILLIGLVSRLVWQKGIDLALPALRQLLFENPNVQFVALGTGDVDLQNELARLGSDFGWKARTFLTYDDTIARRIYASSDLFLMPSHFEPCGTSQMFAMRYGSLPLVRDTGGLADTVENYDNGSAERGTGFVFNWEESDAVLGTLRWAFNTFNQNPGVWTRMQKRAMQRDFSWNASARSYIDLYEKAIKKRKE